MRYAALFLMGFLMEAIWALGTQGLQNRAVILSFAMAITAPYVDGIAQALKVVDEKDWRWRLVNITFYSAGACVGLAVTFPW